MVEIKEIYSNWLNKPNKINSDDTILIKELIDNYPFCTTSRILYLKSLQNTNNINFNHTLKKTAAYSPDRKQLFYFLTKDKSKIAKIIPNKKDLIDKIPITKKNIQKKLKIGQPLEFQKKEKHSFNEWLKLSQVKPINRIKDTENQLHKKVNLIEDFIVNRDRKIKKDAYKFEDKANESIKFQFDIVTETLAKVYLEQGHYEKAKAAYHQLSLKYPKKSSLFASQIELIDQLINK